MIALTMPQVETIFNIEQKASNLSLQVRWIQKTHSGRCSPCFCSVRQQQATEEYCDNFPLHPLLQDGCNVDLEYDEFTGEVCLTESVRNAIAHLVEVRSSSIKSAYVIQRIPQPSYVQS